MIVLNPNKTKGRQVYRIVMDAVNARKKSDDSACKLHFCEAAGLSRTTLHRLRRGDVPGHDVLMKVAKGLAAWGIDASIEFSE